MFGRARRVAVILIGLALLGGCTTTVAGSAQPASSVAADPVDPNTAVAGSACQPKNLMSCVLPAPAGSTPDPAPFAPNGPVSLAQFVAAFYPDDAKFDNQITNQLHAQGLLSIAHRDWITGNGDRAEIVLLDFASDTGARGRAQAIESGTAQDPTLSTFTGPGVPAGIRVFYAPKPDQYGNVTVRAYGSFGPVELEFNFFHPATIDSATLTSWLSQQAALLSKLP